MAESSSPAKPKAVEAIRINGRVPKEYIHKEEDFEATGSCVPTMEIPVIDLALVSFPSAEGEAELKNLYSALSSCGCFQAINHGIPTIFLDELHSITKQFFALPLEMKQKYLREVDDHDGYGNDPVLSENQILDWSDRLSLLIVPQDQRKLKFWPQNPPKFREIIHEYSMKLEVILELLFKAMARSLNLDERCFVNKCGEPGEMHVRFNSYPRCPSPNLVLGLKPHADGSALTMLLPDKQVEGLQFLKDDQWLKVCIHPDALLVNVGDIVEIMTNGIFKSPLHRVVTNSERDRTSLAVFCYPDPEKEIEPIEELINCDRPRLYKSVKDYGKTYLEYYQQGKRPIDAVRILNSNASIFDGN
ncbi:hypothetical protein Ancab_035136 [Ancistrocladus abbreviatus]